MLLGKSISAALAAIALITCCGGTPASAAVLLFEGTFSATFATSSNDYSGSFSFQFDDSQVIGEGDEFFTPLLTSLSFSPSPYGTVTYDTSNVAGLLIYSDGNLQAGGIGGIQDGILGYDPNTDDFVVLFQPSGGNLNYLEAVGTHTGEETDVAPGGSATMIAVPEPTAGVLLTVLTAGLALRRRQR